MNAVHMEIDVFMGIPELSETIEESEILCDGCGKLIGFIKWFTDMTTPCPICSKKQTPEEATSTHKMMCIDCRSVDT